LKEKYALIEKMNVVEERSASLEKEKQNLLQELEKEVNWQKKLESENVELKVALKNNKGRTMQLKDNLVKIEKTIEQLNSQVNAVEMEKAGLREQNNKLKLDLSALSKEIEGFKLRFSSISELKKAIIDLKKQASGDAQNQAVDGNQGYVIKDGKSTFPAKVVIEVNPALNQ